MRDIDLSRCLDAIGGSDPSPEFVDRLRAELDFAGLADVDRVASANGDALDMTVLLDPAPSKGPGAPSVRRSRPAFAAAAILLLTLGALFLRSVGDTSIETASAVDIANNLELLALDASIAEDRSLALLATAVSVDSSPQRLARLAAALSDSGKLVVASAEFESPVSVAIAPDAESVIVNSANPLLWTLGDGDVTPLAIGTGPAANFTSEGLVFIEKQGPVYSLDGKEVRGGSTNVGVLSTDGSRRVLVNANTVHVYDAATGEELHRSNQLVSGALGARSNVDATLLVTTHLASVTADSHIEFWDTDTPGFSIEHPLAEYSLKIAPLLDFAPDGRSVALGVDGRIVVLDAESFEPIFAFPASANLSRISYTDDSRSIVAQTDDGTLAAISVWDAATGIELLPPRPITSSQNFGNFLHRPQQGRVAAIGVGGNSVEVLVVDPAYWVELSCEVSSYRLSDEERASFGVQALRPCRD